MYITKEVEVWVDRNDGLVSTEDLEDLFPLADALLALHDENHGGSVWICPHPACYAAYNALKAFRRLRLDGRGQHPSLLALHSQGEKLRRIEGIRIPTPGGKP